MYDEKAIRCRPQKIWDAIEHYHGLKQVVKFCKQKYSMEEEEVESELQNMIEDGLVIVNPGNRPELGRVWPGSFLTGAGNW